jgi:hypothetical protein
MKIAPPARTLEIVYNVKKAFGPKKNQIALDARTRIAWFATKVLENAMLAKLDISWICKGTVLSAPITA